LFRRYRSEENCRSVSSDEIYSMIAAVLSDTNYERAAAVLQEHRLNRQIKRGRTEVFHCCAVSEFADRMPAAMVTAKQEKSSRGSLDEPADFNVLSDDICFTASLWDKSAIVRDLEDKMAVEHNLARTVAAIVEEKVLKMNFRRVLSSVVREIVKNELWQLMQAEANFNCLFTKKPSLEFSPVRDVPAKISQCCEFAAEGVGDYRVASQV
jgi:hypothetical protein